MFDACERLCASTGRCCSYYTGYCFSWHHEKRYPVLYEHCLSLRHVFLGQETRDETLRTSAIDECHVTQPAWYGEAVFESMCRQKTENTSVATVDLNFLSKTKWWQLNWQRSNFFGSVQVTANGGLSCLSLFLAPFKVDSRTTVKGYSHVFVFTACSRQAFQHAKRWNGTWAHKKCKLTRF